MRSKPIINRESTGTRKQILIPLALGAVYLFWGGTYLGMKVAIETLPPFIMAGLRFLTAGAILYLWARGAGVGRPTPRQWRGAAAVGALLLVGGNGLVAWAEQRVPSGIASLLVAMVPIWMLALGLLDRKGASKGRWPNAGVVLGMILGLAGIAVLVGGTGNALRHQGLSPVGIGVLLAASISWAGGSLYSRKASLPDSALLGTAMQMLVGGGLLLLVALFLGEWPRFHPAAVSARSCLALGYLILFGSILGYNAYIWLLKNAEPAWVSTYAFVNPVVAVFLGWALLGEELTGRSLVAAIVIIAAVGMITIFRDVPRK